ncbi:hypothetical protein HY498_01740 [Candidatus Woesearchaeota archaeon]|nr:hypothetical protein [Candidatus Woesearchaeota archaeon]
MGLIEKIELPSNLETKALLERKLEECKEKYNSVISKADRFIQLDLLYKLWLLETLSNEGEINTREIQEYFHRTVGYLCLKPFNNALGVINDLCVNKGRNVIDLGGIDAMEMYTDLFIAGARYKDGELYNS